MHLRTPRKNSSETNQVSGVPFELEALIQARRYQLWIIRRVRPFLGARILEIGAGIGSMSRWLPIRERLIVTESDPVLYELLESRATEWQADSTGKVSLRRFDLLRDPLDPYFAENLDTIISFNVLEHIEDDRLALQHLVRILQRSRPGRPRRIVSFVPAHSWAYGKIDQSFGHFRRYSSAGMRRLAAEITPEAVVHNRYFNVVGLGGWVLNGRILRRRRFGLGAVKIADALCPVLAPIDDFLHDSIRLPLGQSLVSVWEWS